jgi:hypothetical protein
MEVRMHTSGKKKSAGTVRETLSVPAELPRHTHSGKRRGLWRTGGRMNRRQLKFSRYSSHRLSDKRSLRARHIGRPNSNIRPIIRKPLHSLLEGTGIQIGTTSCDQIQRSTSIEDNRRNALATYAASLTIQIGY